jgi:hypothetical protein
VSLISVKTGFTADLEIMISLKFEKIILIGLENFPVDYVLKG